MLQIISCLLGLNRQVLRAALAVNPESQPLAFGLTNQIHRVSKSLTGC